MTHKGNSYKITPIPGPSLLTLCLTYEVGKPSELAELDDEIPELDFSQFSHLCTA